MWIGPEANTSLFSSAQQHKHTELMMAAASSTEQPKGSTRGMEYSWLIPEHDTMILTSFTFIKWCGVCGAPHKSKRHTNTQKNGHKF